MTIEIGMFDLGKLCPFLSEERLCTIHTHNPLDCRTYPLLPVLNYPRELEWQLSDTCPSAMLLNSKFGEGVKRIWHDLLPVLPQAWWDLYAFADHWKGWPDPAEERDAS